mgnify:CR=1 FL=1
MNSNESNCLIIAGEKSGEDHAMTFFEELKGYCPETNFFGVGGDKLKSSKVELIYHLNSVINLLFRFIPNY